MNLVHVVQQNKCGSANQAKSESFSNQIKGGFMSHIGLFLLKSATRWPFSQHALV